MLPQPYHNHTPKAGAVLVAMATAAALAFQAFVLPSLAVVVPFANKLIPNMLQIEVVQFDDDDTPIINPGKVPTSVLPLENKVQQFHV